MNDATVHKVKSSPFLFSLGQLLQRHPRRVTAAIAAILMSTDTLAVASLTPAKPPRLVRLVSEPVYDLLSSRAKNAKWTNCKLVLSRRSQFSAKIGRASCRERV